MYIQCAMTTPTKMRNSSTALERTMGRMWNLLMRQFWPRGSDCIAGDCHVTKITMYSVCVCVCVCVCDPST